MNWIDVTDQQPEFKLVFESNTQNPDITRHYESDVVLVSDGQSWWQARLKKVCRIPVYGTRTEYTSWEALSGKYPMNQDINVVSHWAKVVLP